MVLQTFSMRQHAICVAGFFIDRGFSLNVAQGSEIISKQIIRAMRVYTKSSLPAIAFFNGMRFASFNLASKAKHGPYANIPRNFLQSQRRTL